ncbi:hypothetical protein KSS87_010460 [Heliosperma pusillum]|nr:hypothetical protein KSS87_010460 [Heliosperma pusillum]
MKTSLDVGLRSISNQLSNIPQKEKIQEIMSTVMTFPNQIQTIVHKQAEQLSKCLSEDLQACNLLQPKYLKSKASSPCYPPSKGCLSLYSHVICTLRRTCENPSSKQPMLQVTGGDSSQQKPLFRSEPQPTKIFNHGHLGSKTELGGWTSVKPERPTQSTRHGNSCRNMKQRRISPLLEHIPKPDKKMIRSKLQARPQKVVVSLDDDSDDDFSCIIVEKELELEEATKYGDKQCGTEYLFMCGRRGDIAFTSAGQGPTIEVKGWVNH